MKSSKLAILWIPGDKKIAKPVNIGVLWVHNFYKGEYYVYPFGKQKLHTFFMTNVWEDPKFFIHQLEDPTSNQTPDENSVISQSVSEVQLQNNHLLIDFKFDINLHYGLYVVWTGTKGNSELEGDMVEKAAFLAHLIPRGVTSFVHATVSDDDTIYLNMPTIRLDTNNDSGSVILARRCKFGKVELPYITPTGAVTSVTTSPMDRYSLFKWVHTENAYDITPGDTLRLCWCGVSLDNHMACTKRDYSIHVGNVYVQPRYTGTVTCYLGRFCMSFVEFKTETPPKYFLSPTCEQSTALEFEREGTYFKTTLVAENKKLVHIKGLLGLSDNLLGGYMLCAEIKSTDGVTMAIEDAKQRFIISRRVLEQNRYYLSMMDSANLIFNENKLYYQYIILSEDCSGPGENDDIIQYVKGSMTAHSHVAGGMYQVCWCLLDSSTSCKNRQDFKIVVGEIYFSGMQKINDAGCNVRSFCSLRLEYWSYYDKIDKITRLPPNNSMLSIQRSECKFEQHDSNLLYFDGLGQDELMEQKDNIHTYINKITFAGIVQHVVPGQYSLCYLNSDTSYAAKISNINLLGAFINSYDIVVYLGKPFTILIRGKYVGEISGFLSTDESCNVEANDERYEVIMTKKPIVIADHTGMDTIIWTNVLILRTALGRRMELHRIQKQDVVYYLCTSTSLGNQNTGYMFSLFSLQMMMRTRTSPPEGMSDIRRHLSPSTYVTLLMIRYINRPSKIESCETNTWRQHLDNMVLSIYKKEDDFAVDNFPTMNYTTNAYICACMGRACLTFGDFRTSIMEPEDIQQSLFTVMPYDMRPITKTLYGSYLSYKDRIKLFSGQYNCGEFESRDLFSSSVTDQSQRTPSRRDKLPATIHLDINRDTVGAVEISKKGGYIWKSRNLPIVNSPGTNNLLYQICFCPFMFKKSCSSTKDYTEWIGSVISSPVRKSGGNMLRITTYPSNVDYRLPQCSHKVASQSDVSYHDMGRSNIELTAFLYDFLTTHHTNRHGFFIEVCEATPSERFDEPLTYQRVFGGLHSGYFPMQMSFVTSGVMQDVVIYGNNLPPGYVTSFVVLRSIGTCENVTKEDRVSFAKGMTAIHSDYVIFRGITIAEPGLYKFCIRIRPKQLKQQNALRWFSVAQDIEMQTKRLQANLAATMSKQNTPVPSPLDASAKTNSSTTPASKTDGSDAHSSPSDGSANEHGHLHNEAKFANHRHQKTKSIEHWETGGLIEVVDYNVFCLPDILILPFMTPSGLPFDTRPQQASGSCSSLWYHNYSVLCVVAKYRIAIVTDCRNNLWLLHLQFYNSKSYVPPQRLNALNQVAEPEPLWKTCKSFLDSQIIFLGSKYITSISLPSKGNGGSILYTFKHGLSSPLDFTIINGIFLISDEYTRSLTAFSSGNLSNMEEWKSRTLLKSCYHKGLYSVERLSVNSELYAIDAVKNNLTRYIVNTDNLDLVEDLVYDGFSNVEGLYAAPLTNLCCVDGNFSGFESEDMGIVLVGESITGRILVLTVNHQTMELTKVINTEVVLNGVQFVNKEELLLSTWRIQQGHKTNCIYLRTIASYVHLWFYYSLFTRYTIGSNIELVPVLKGDKFDYFVESEKDDRSSITLGQMGLQLHTYTGVITGSLRLSGCHTVEIIGANLLKLKSYKMSICGICPPSHQFNLDTQTCEQCPIGFYRNDEKDDVCLSCETLRKNSTTVMLGARVSGDCLCDKNYYLKDDECVPCEAGTFKNEVGNSPCTGTCAANREYMKKVVNGKTVSVCMCMPKYFDQEIAIRDWMQLLPEMWNIIGLTFDYDTHQPTNMEELLGRADACLPCPVGYYCPGEEALPKKCPFGYTTKDTANDSESSCVCDRGYGSFPNVGCQVCSGFGYKDVVGNAECKLCQDDPFLPATVPLLPIMGRIHVVTEATWEKELAQYRDFQGELYPALTELLQKITLFSDTDHSRTSDRCKYCIGGTYFDVNTRSCLECPTDRFCPGGDYQPLSCGFNGFTRTHRSVTGMDCFCERGYGNTLEGRHPTTGAIACYHCPAGYFQHLQYVDYGCLPCPKRSSTYNYGATSLFFCSPDSGTYLSVTRKNRKTQTVTDLLNEYGENFEDMLMHSRDHATVACYHTVRSSIKGLHSEKVLRDSFSTCKSTCLYNIYCYGFLYEPTIRFVEYDSNPHNAYETTVFNGLRFLKRSYGTCTLYFFSLEFDRGGRFNGRDTSADDIVSVCRIYDNTYDYEFVTKPCPIGYYCQGNSGYTRCPDNSTTMAEGAYDSRQCLCLAGYEASTSQNSLCVPCSIGSYKQEIGNVSCKRCPDRFRTFKTGSKYITDCACSSGYYAEFAKSSSNTGPETIYKRLKNHTVLLSSEEDMLNTYKELVLEKQEISEFVYDHSNPYIVKIPNEIGSPSSNVDSFIFLSKALLTIPQNSPAAIIPADYHMISCERCKISHYCPGGWAASSDRMIHNIPYRCPEGANVPTEATNATSVTQCLCLPGYRLNTDAPEGVSVAMQNLMMKRNSKLLPDDYDWFPKLSDIENATSTATGSGNGNNDPLKLDPTTMQSTSEHGSVDGRWVSRRSRAQCVKCEAGMYKEGQENSSCSGRCMQNATTYGGAVSQKQCFCNYGRYMTLDDTLGSMQLRCAPCLKGAVCPGGFFDSVIEELKGDRTFTKIRLHDHRRPMARFGYFGAFKHQGIDLWSPVTQYPSSLNQISTDLLDFHACPLEYLCTSDNAMPCDVGSTGYTCMNCIDGYERSYFRSNCLPCSGIPNAIYIYLKTKVFLWIICSAILYLLHKKLYYQFVIIKIWLEFWLSMVPYGLFPLNSSSSLQRFSTKYNMIFGYQQRFFSYVRVSCMAKRFFNYNLSTFQSWYAQRLLIVVQPAFDGLTLYFMLLILRILFYPIGKVRRRLSRRYSTWSSSGSSVSSYDDSASWNATTKTNTNETNEIVSGEIVVTNKKPPRKRSLWLGAPRCILVMYYLSFQFICQELLQTLWCVPVQYKSEPPISVLLYHPSTVCDFKDRMFLFSIITSCFLLGSLFLTSMFLVFLSVRKRGYMHLFSSGRQRHTLSWDAVLFFRRLCVAVVVIFQPYTLSTGSSEKLRMIGSLLITTVLLILHLSVLPYQVRDDNLFNRLELFSMLLNSSTGFLILGSFSYDFNYTGLFPLGASILYSCLLLWYMLVECGFIADLRPALRRRFGIIPNFWSFCRHLLLWHCHSHITFNYKSAEVVIERPFTGHTSSINRAVNNKRHYHVSTTARRGMCLCIEQSVNRYVMEQRKFCVPIYWEEFLVRYSFAYKHLNQRLRCGNVVGANVRVNDTTSSEIFDGGPINPWQMSIATLNVPISSLISNYREFESRKLGLLYELKCTYSELGVEATEALADRDTNVREMIAKVHELERLRKLKSHLHIKMTVHLRNAKEGQRVTHEVQDIDAGIVSLVDTPLTNDEIIEKIRALNLREESSNSHIM
uniref:GCC2 and GCC3 domain containing protein n=2 Tax=Babesia bovis TaxID=5865 RepID=A7AR15_BABBO|eukprot:XP_001610552.1 GCC2 and GCC3 domain containing protein [Babesia bovis T2Bo]